MLIVISYDISVAEGAKGAARLRKVAKLCQNYGQRVQNSVFECQLEYAKYLQLKNNILKIIDLKTDSVRFYQMGKDWRTKIEHYGIKASKDFESDLLLF